MMVRGGSGVGSESRAERLPPNKELLPHLNWLVIVFAFLVGTAPPTAVGPLALAGNTTSDVLHDIARI